jgi:hypothetical protein
MIIRLITFALLQAADTAAFTIHSKGRSASRYSYKLYTDLPALYQQTHQIVCANLGIGCAPSLCHDKGKSSGVSCLTGL